MKIERMLQSHKSQHIHHEVTAFDRWHYQAETDMVALGSEIKNEKKNLIYCLLEAHQKLFKGLFAHVDCGNLGKAEVYSLC